VNEAVRILNKSDTGHLYQWDFCSGDLLKDPTAKNVNNIMESVTPIGIDIVNDEGNWYGFVVSRDNNKIVRLDFGTDLNNTPIKVDLGNVGDLLDKPQSVKLAKDDGTWFAFVQNMLSNEFVKITIGENLSGKPIGADIILNSNGWPNNGFDISFDGENWVAVLGKSYRLTMINFGKTLFNIPQAGDIITSDVIEGVNSISDVNLTNYDGTWIGIMTASTTKNLKKLIFGNSLFTMPSIESLNSSFLESDVPYGIELQKEDSVIIGHIVTLSGNFYKIQLYDLANDITATKLGNLNILSNTLKIAMAKQSSEWKAFSINYTTRELYRFDFPNDCSANDPISNQYNPANLYYSKSGTKSIELMVTSNTGCSQHKAQKIHIDNTSAPTISFTSNDNTCIANENTFTATFSDDPSITSWSWDFGDGNGTAPGQNVNYQFLDTGSYEVSLSIDAENGCSNTARQVVSIYNPPQAGFTFPPGILCSNSPVDFFNNTTFFGPDSIITYNWNFNEEAFLSAKDTSFIFSSGGDKTITLSASIPGCTSEASEIISITPGPLTAFAFDGTCVYDGFNFINKTTGDDITGYLWDFGDGYTSTNVSPKHRYESGGTYAVSLSASNVLGCQSTLQQVVPVRYIPSPNFTNDLACSDNRVKFYDQSSVPEANITEQYWTLVHNESGYEASQTGPSPTFHLATAGEYALELIVKSNYGCADTLVRNDVIVKPSPTADFSIQETCLGDSTIFIEQADFPDNTELNSVEWLIEENLYSGESIRHRFTQPDDYEVEMFLRSSNFCTDHITKTVQILPLPDLDIALSALCAEQPVSINALVNSPLDPVHSYQWEIDNTPISNRESFVYEFDDAQNYLINLAVLTENDCYNYLIQDFTIYPSPVSEFELFPSIGASPLEVSFTDLSRGASGVTYDFSNFNDDTSHAFNPVYTYTELGKDWPRQIAENEFGCTDTSYNEIEVVIPVYDLAITDVRIEVVDQQLSMIVELANNGTIIINNPDLKIDIDETITLNHKLEGRLMPGDEKIFQIDFDIVLGSQPINYLCFSLNSSLGAYEDINPYDNTYCISLENDFNALEPYPNPARDFVNFPVILPSGSQGQMIVTSDKGGIVYQKDFKSLNAGLNLFELDLTTFARGIYIVNIKLDDFETIKKVVVH